MNRTIIIGDLHGMHDSALELLDKCEVTKSDRVIFLGDLVDRGDESGKCVDLAMKHECVLGNHEERHLDYHNIEKRKGRVNIESTSHIATREQLRPEHFKYFETLPLYIRLPEFNAVAVHAGMFPFRTVEAQSKRHLLHIQSINPFDENGNPTGNEKSMWTSKAHGLPGWKFWTNYWQGPERIIFGHSVLDKPLVTEHAVGIDGGCCFGLSLHALILPSWEIVSVTGGAGSKNRDRGLFNIHGDVSAY